MRLLILALSALALAGCNVGASVPAIPTPSEYAQRTAADEQMAVGVELAYKAFRTGLELSVDAGLLKGSRATAAAQADRRAYAALLSFRAAYKTANAPDLSAAARSANNAIAHALATLKGA